MIVCVYVPAYVCVSVRVCVCTCVCLHGAPHTWPLFHLGSCATYSEYLYSSSYSTRAVLSFFFKSRLRSPAMLAVNIIANLSLQIMVGLGHWKVYIDCVHNQQVCYILSSAVLCEVVL